jgi:hypothetical protein
MSIIRHGKIVAIVLGALAAAASFADWSPPETITPPEGDWRTCYNFSRSLVADDAGNLHAVFFENKGGAAYYRRYDRATGRWGASYRLDEEGGADACLIIDARGKLHAFFQANSRVCHRVADDAGRWSAHEYIVMSGCRFGKPSPLALPSGDVALAMVGEYTTGRPTHIWYTVWHRETQRMDPPVCLTESTGENGSWMPTMAYFHDEIRLAWRDDSTGEFEIYERRFDGSQWTPTRRLTYDPAPSFHPRLAIDGNGVLHLLFMDKRTGKAAIWEMVDYGGGWSTERILYDGGGRAYHPNCVLIPTGQLVVCWEDNREAPLREIYFGSLFGGVWSEAGRVTHTPDEDSTLASPTFGAGEIAVAYDEGPGKVCVQRLPLDEVPVAGVSFGARPETGAVKLHWDGDAAGAFDYFHVYRRSTSNEDWRRVNEAPIAGRRPYTYTDGTTLPGEYAYKLEGRTGTGYALALGTARVMVGGGAAEFISGLSVAPNPCRGALRLAWRQEAPAAAAVAAYDLSGRRVASASAVGGIGANALALETSRLAPGAYVAVLSAGGNELSKVFVVTR